MIDTSIFRHDNFFSLDGTTGETKLAELALIIHYTLNRFISTFFGMKLNITL